MMFKRLKEARAAKQRRDRIRVLKNRKAFYKKKGRALVLKHNEKYPRWPDTIENWYTFLPQGDKDAYDAVAEEWYKLSYPTKSEWVGQDISYSGVTKENLLEIDDLRNRLYKIIYPDKAAKDLERCTAVDNHTEIEFDDGTQLVGTVTKYEDGEVKQTSRFLGYPELQKGLSDN